MQPYATLTLILVRFRQLPLEIMQTGGLAISILIMIPDRGIRRRKDQVPLRDVVTEYTQEVLAQRLDYVSIYRAGISGTFRVPVLLSCIAGAGLGAGAGTASPAINGLRGEFPEGRGVAPS